MESKSTQSLWLGTAEQEQLPQLQRNLYTEICVIGGGISGLTTAYFLSKTGKDVVLLDAGNIPGGETTMTTAHLSWVLDNRFYELQDIHGVETTKLALESHLRAIQTIEDLTKAEEIECEFKRVPGYLFEPKSDDETVGAILEKEVDALRRMKIDTVQFVDHVPHTDINDPCLVFPNQAQFNPLLYTKGLVKAVLKNRGRIFARSRVTKITGKKSFFVETENGFTVTSNCLVVATNTPINNRFVLHTKQAAYQTYAIALEVSETPKDAGLYWDTPDPYHYVRFCNIDNKQFLIVGGEDHKTGQANDGTLRHERLEHWVRKRFTGLGPVRYRWSGEVMEPHDGMAFIGKNPMDMDGVYIVTGDSGQGMTHGTIAGRLIHDLIMDIPNPWEKIYDPGRVRLKSLKNFIQENTNTMEQYFEWMKPNTEEIQNLPPEEGIVVRNGLHMLAVYKDEKNKVTACSATCPHLGCIVQWNSTAKSWDCPCHGSRFTAKGEVFHGPAVSNLEPYHAESKKDDDKKVENSSSEMSM